MKWHLLVLAALAALAEARPWAEPQRPFGVDDLFNLQALTDVQLSPDGSSIAVVIQRTWSDPVITRPFEMFGNDRADVWLLSAEGGLARNITRGAKDGSGYWHPVWSPDSQRLALLSTAGGDNVRLYSWDRRSDRLQRLSDLGVDDRSRLDAGARVIPLQWLDNRRVLVTLLPKGEQPLEFRFRRQTQRLASEAWKKAAFGHEPTSSVLDAGMPVDRPQRLVQLCAIDVVTKDVTTFASGDIRHAIVAPDREHVAVIVRVRSPFPGRIPVAGEPQSSRLGIAAVRGHTPVRWIDGVANPIFEFDTHPHRWSPRGTALGVIGFDRPQAGARSVFVVSAADLSIRKIADDLIPSTLAWADDEQLLVRGRAAGRGERADWWSSPVGGAPRNLTAALAVPPSELVATRRQHEMIGIADGALWSFDVTDAGHRRLTDPQARSIETLVWPRLEERLCCPIASVIARGRLGDAVSLVRVDLSSTPTKVSSFFGPPKATTLAAYHPGRNLAVFTAPQDPDGTFLWTGIGSTTDFAKRIALNEQLAGIAGGEQTLIDYRSTDGQDLKGMLFLPVGYQKGTRYPLITWVYPGYVIRSLASASDWGPKNHAHQDNLHIFAGHGYAVLIPSMPVGSPALRDLGNGILPAVDRVIELGIADPDRVAVVGQSGGGAAVYGLITQTKRFKAAVAINGIADRVSAYGVFDGRVRYTDDVDDKFAPWGSPPWENVDRFADTNPIAVIDRVETPLLIVHGDIDFIPIEQAEEVFTSLARLGKRVRFVRYWGESHGVDSPANVRDRWHHILGWLDTYLRTS